MEKKKDVLKRNLEQKHFENAMEAIKGGKESGNLTNVEFVRNLVESYKGKTVRVPIEVIIASAIFLNARELMSTIEVLRHTLHIKMAEEMAEELKEKVDKGEATVSDGIAALMLAEIMKK